MTPNHDQLYEVYELYLSNRKPGDPYWTFSGWLQHAGLSEKVPIQAHCMGVEFPARTIPPTSVNLGNGTSELGPMQRKCLAGELVNPLAAEMYLTPAQLISAIAGVPEKALVKLNRDIQKTAADREKSEGVAGHADVEQMKPKWFMEERGRRWRYCLGEKVLGFVVWNFCGWDAYLLLNKKWPNDRKSIWYYSATGSNTCWEARRAVERAVEDAADLKLASRPESRV